MTTYRDRVMKICEELFRKEKAITWRYEVDPFHLAASLTVFFYDLNTCVRIPLPNSRCPDYFLEEHIRHQMKDTITGLYLKPKESTQ